MSDTAHQRANEFLHIADQFKLGPLVTEASHPVTANLSEVAREDVAAALSLLFQVDGDVVRTYREVVGSGRLERIADDVLKALQGGGRLFFTGCGSTGRLSILLDSIWRDFWQQQTVVRTTSDPSGETWEDRTFSVMAGGDFALIKAVEGFEDYTAFGRKQIRDLGVRGGDVVFSITEGGETSFVIGTAWEGVDAGAKVFFVYNNPDEVLCNHVERSREVIEDGRIEQLNLTTGPMAISGSTRMQATTIQLCVLVTVLEMVVRRLVRGSHEKNPDAAERFLEGLEVVHKTLLSQPVLDGLASLVAAEVATYSTGGRANYHADRFAIDVLTDTTERSPTFSTPAFRKQGDVDAAESWSFLFLPQRSTVDAWEWILKREPRCIDWTDADIRGLVPTERLERLSEVLQGIRGPELMKFRVGRDGMTERPAREQDFGLAVVSAVGLGTALHDRGVEDWLEEAGQSKAGGGVLCFTDLELQSSLRDQAVAGAGRLTLVTVQVPRTGFLLDGLTRVAVKMVLNALSTCVMVRLGRVMGNTMIYVVPSNLKLIDRATRYISRLAGLDYADANRLLFAAVEYVEPRMMAGQEYPSVVGLAVLMAREGVDFKEAEAALQTRSGAATLV